MATDTIHLKPSKARLSVLLLLIPVTVFVGVLALVYTILTFLL